MLAALPLALAAHAFADDDKSRPSSSSGPGGHDSEDHTNGNNSEDDSSSNSSTNVSSSVPTAGANAAARPATVGALSRLPVLDADQAKLAIAKGQAASMSLLLAYLKINYPGEVVDVKLHDAGNSYIYEVRYLANVIFLHTVYLDAQSLKAM